MEFAIVTDSTCNLTEEMIDEYDLTILPLVFMCEGEQFQSYLKGEHTDLQQFYRMMREGKIITTSLPNPIETEKTCRTILSEGKDILYLGFSSGLSGTFAAIDALLRDLAGEFPDRTIRSVDTLAASGGQGLVVHNAVQKARGGMGIDEIADWVEANLFNHAHWFTVDDLMFLFRGGRVSKTSAWAGTVLNIKPVLHVDNAGRLIPMEKVRGRKKALNALVAHMRDSATEPIADQTVFLNHGDCLEDAEYVADKIREEFGEIEIIINYIDPVIGAHAGPGTVALFFMANGR